MARRDAVMFWALRIRAARTGSKRGGQRPILLRLSAGTWRVRTTRSSVLWPETTITVSRCGSQRMAWVSTICRPNGTPLMTKSPDESDWVPILFFFKQKTAYEIGDILNAARTDP